MAQRSCILEIRLEQEGVELRIVGTIISFLNKITVKNSTAVSIFVHKEWLPFWVMFP